MNTRTFEDLLQSQYKNGCPEGMCYWIYPNPINAELNNDDAVQAFIHSIIVGLSGSRALDENLPPPVQTWDGLAVLHVALDNAPFEEELDRDGNIFLCQTFSFPQLRFGSKPWIVARIRTVSEREGSKSRFLAHEYWAFFPANIKPENTRDYLRKSFLLFPPATLMARRGEYANFLQAYPEFV